jgi:preprotein translocase SecE subunit
MPEPVKVDPKNAKKPVDARLASAQDRLASLSKTRSGAKGSVSQYIKETWRELKLTTWPDRTTLEKSTYVVLAFIVATALFTGTIDFVLGRATSALLQP